MNSYHVSQIYMSDKVGLDRVRTLLAEEGLSLDRNLDYICGIYDSDRNLIATGSCFANSLRCFAVRSDHKGEGLLNSIISHLINVQFQRGNSRLFLYSKAESAKFFSDLAFYEIARVKDRLVFMENSRTGFSDYLANLKKSSEDFEAGFGPIPSGQIGALVMNANPFSLGHRYLIEKATAESALVHLFILSEDVGPIPFRVRKKLLLEGTKDLKNLIIHDSGPYIISSATFPSYFSKDGEEVIRNQALLDINIFKKIAGLLGITKRYVGHEPTSLVTGIYNEIMEAELPKAGVACQVIPRKEFNNKPISASTIRQLLQKEAFGELEGLLPPSGLAFFKSPEARQVIENLKAEEDVAHY